MKKNPSLIKSSCLFVVLTVLGIAVHGQQILDEQSFNDFLKLQRDSSIGKSILSGNDISGSPYLSEDFILGNLLTNNKIKYTNVPLRYNIYNDEMEFKVGKDTYLAISNPKSLQEIKIGDDVFIHAFKKNKKAEQSGYYKLLKDGKIQLLSGLIVVFKEATITSGYNQSQPPKFQRNADKYFLRIGYSKPISIAKRKDIKTIFGAESDLVYTYIKKHQLNVREKEDLIKLIEYLNN